METNANNNVENNVNAEENKKEKRTKANREQRKLKPVVKWALIGAGAVIVGSVGYVVVKAVLTKRPPSGADVAKVAEAVEKAAEVAAI